MSRDGNDRHIPMPETAGDYIALDVEAYRKAWEKAYGPPPYMHWAEVPLEASLFKLHALLGVAEDNVFIAVPDKHTSPGTCEFCAFSRNSELAEYCKDAPGCDYIKFVSLSNYEAYRIATLARKLEGK